MTKYVILIAKDGGWHEIGPQRVTASSDQAAIRLVSAKRGEGIYVAVPARSWRPTTVTVENVAKVKLAAGFATAPAKAPAEASKSA